MKKMKKNSYVKPEVIYHKFTPLLMQFDVGGYADGPVLTKKINNDYAEDLDDAKAPENEMSLW